MLCPVVLLLLSLLPYLPVYNAHFFSPKIASKMRMRIIHGILLFGVVCLITIKTKKLNVLKYHWSLIEEPNRTIHNTGEKTIKI